MPPRNSKVPDSDTSARKETEDMADEVDARLDPTPVAQTSNKSGKHSSVEKQAASRPEAGPGPGAQPTPGAFGKDEEDVHVPGDGRKSSA